eukprot:8556521-Alexandrium_andersonii.AAC.1
MGVGSPQIGAAVPAGHRRLKGGQLCLKGGTGHGDQGSAGEAAPASGDLEGPQGVRDLRARKFGNPDE